MNGPVATRIRAVTFDVGGTLIVPYPSVGAVYADVAHEFGHAEIDPRQVEYQFKDAWLARSDFNYSRQAWYGLVRQAYKGQMASVESSLLEAVYERFAQPESWKVQEDVLPALEILASNGFKLGIISNWDERLRPLLERLKLRPYFDSVVVSCEVGFTKPSPVIFEHAVRNLRVSPDSVVHVGDNIAEDVNGALAAGLAAFLVDRNAHSGDATLSALTELEWRVE